MIMVRLSFTVVVLLRLSCGALVGDDGPLPGVVQPVPELFWSFEPFHPNLVTGSMECWLLGFHSVGQEEQGVLN